MAKISLERKLVDWAGHAKLAKLSSSDVQKAAKALGVSAADVKAAVAKLNATEFGGTAKRSNKLEGSSHTKAPHKASGSLGFDAMPLKVSIMWTNESAANIAIGAAKQAGEPVKIHLDDKGLTLIVPPDMTHAEFFQAVSTAEEKRRQRWAAEYPAAAQKQAAPKPEMHMPRADLEGMQAAIRTAQDKGHPINVLFEDLGRVISVSPKTNAFDLGETIRRTAGN